MKGTLTAKKYALYWIVGLAITAAVFFLCVCVGTEASGPTFNWPDESFILDLRFTRVETAALVGAALAASGVVLQSLLRNPLADPYVLGIASGANLGVRVWLTLGTAISKRLLAPALLVFLLGNGQSIPALLGAAAASLIVFSAARFRRGSPIEPITLLLTGVVVSACAGALYMLLTYYDGPNAAFNAIPIIMGSITDGAGVWQMRFALAVFLAGFALALYLAARMNVAALSDAESTSLGVRLPRLRTLSFLSASLMTAAAITLAGPIGFVGLICPHICRILFGPDQRQLIVTATFFGAIFLMAADALVIGFYNQFQGILPVGIVTALVGGPFFILLLRRSHSGEPA